MSTTDNENSRSAVYVEDSIECFRGKITVPWERISLNIMRSQCIYRGVRLIRTMMALFLALAWLPVTSHCQMEVLPGLEFLQCGTDNSQTDNCGEDGCCAVESSSYQSTRHDESNPLIVLNLLAIVPVPVLEASLPQEVSLGVLSSAPPEISRSWQFFSRSALPVRAPSSAS